MPRAFPGSTPGHPGAAMMSRSSPHPGGPGIPGITPHPSGPGIRGITRPPGAPMIPSSAHGPNFIRPENFNPQGPTMQQWLEETQRRNEEVLRLARELRRPLPVGRITTPKSDDVRSTPYSPMPKSSASDSANQSESESDCAEEPFLPGMDEAPSGETP